MQSIIAVNFNENISQLIKGLNFNVTLNDMDILVKYQHFIYEIIVNEIIYGITEYDLSNSSIPIIINNINSKLENSYFTFSINTTTINLKIISLIFNIFNSSIIKALCMIQHGALAYKVQNFLYEVNGSYVFKIHH